MVQTTLAKRPRRAAHAVARGFTLIEVMIVIAIVLALSGLIAVNVLSRQEQAKGKLAQIDMNNIKSALKQFRLDFDRWPTDEEGIRVLWDKSALSADADADKWRKYMDEPLPNDRWDTAWGYRQVSEHGDDSQFDLWSFGPDKQEGTDDDVVSWTTDADAMGESAPAGAGR